MRDSDSTRSPPWRRCVVLALACCCLLAAGAQAQETHYTFPTKSINLDKAAQPEFYKIVPTFNFPAGFEDPHPVHGIQTSAGDYVLVGKGMDGLATESFAVKLNSEGVLQWFWTSKMSQDDAANAVAQVSPTEVVVVGWATYGAIGKRTIWKLSLSTGAEVWKVAFDSPNAALTSAYENLEVAPRDKSVYFSGFVNKNNLEEMSFKSYGNVPDGTALVERMDLEKLQSAQAPVLSDFTWTRTWPDYVTSKACRVVDDAPDSQLGVLLYAEGKMASVIVLKTSTGNPHSSVWNTPRDYSDHGEATDLQICVYKSALILSGHGGTSSPKTLNGRMSRISIQDGSRTWTRSYSVGGNEQVIFNECWGLARIGDFYNETSGYAMTCGAGIENCQGMSGTMLSDCQGGRPVAGSDPRPGAYQRPAAVWQSYLIKVDQSGTLQYQRVDQYREPGSADLGQNGWSLTSSASEWVIATNDGGMALVQDEQQGIGLFKLFPEQHIPSPSPSPPSSPPANNPYDNFGKDKDAEDEEEKKGAGLPSWYRPVFYGVSVLLVVGAIAKAFHRRRRAREAARQQVDYLGNPVTGVPVEQA